MLINIENRTGAPASLNGAESNVWTTADGSSSPVASGAFIVSLDPSGKEQWTSFVERPAGNDQAPSKAQYFSR